MNKHFNEAAKIVVANMKSPTEFINFVTNAMIWVNQYESGPARDRIDCHFYLGMMIERIGIPWIESPKKATMLIAAEIEDISGWNGYECYHDHLGIIFEAFGSSFKGGMVPASEMQRYMLGLQTFTKIGECIQSWEREIEQNKKAA